MTRCCLALTFALVYLVPLAAQTPEQTRGTIDYLTKLQTKEGGFLAAAPEKGKKPALPSLRATSSAIRAFHYLKGELPNKDAVVKFVAACYDKDSGGFKDHPSAKAAEFGPTAVGIMAVVELGLPLETYQPGVAKFLSDNGKTFEEIRIAAAAFETMKAKGKRNDAWLAEVNKLWNGDGTSGKADGQPRATGGLAVTVLRFGGKLPNEKAVLKAIVDGQQLNGGYGKEGSPVADLETSYRVARAFHMLKQKPADVEALRSFVLKCRNDDHGYGISPGEPSSVSATYFASIILNWMPKE